MKMDKLHHFLALLQVALILGACANEAPEWGGSEVGDKTTSMRFEVRVSADDTGTRAVSQTEEGGTKNECSVSSMTVLFSRMPYRTFAENQLKVAGTDVISSPIFEVNESDAGSVDFSVLLNGSKIVPGLLTDQMKNKTITLSEFDKLVDTSDEVGGFKDFMMTATAKDNKNNTVTILPNISENQVKYQGDNTFSLDVERVLSKVQVRRASKVTLSGDVATEKGKLDVERLEYALAGSAKEAYLFRDFTGLENKIVDNEYPFYESKIHSKKVAPEWKGTDEHPFLQRVSDKMEGGAGKNFEAKSVDVKDATKSTTNGIYFLENSTNQNISGRNQLEYNRIAYVKIYGTFVPKEVQYYVYDKEKDEEFLTVGTLDEAHKNAYDWFYVDQDYSEKEGCGRDEDDPADIWYTYDSDGHKLYVNDPVGTFYYGEESGVLYGDLYSALRAGNTNLRRYVGGKMVWLAPVNAQIVGEGNDAYVKNADTRRNNIYDLTISSINGFGLPYDPVDPYDPNIPKKDNPFDDTPDSHIKVDPLTQLVRIHASILKWNIQELNYDF
ncbi:MAG: Mfa1 family fimbria major subunit [Fermentimonas sp.]|jgi:hypothetical protein